MKQDDILSILRRQRDSFASGATLPVENRIAALKRLYKAIAQNEERIAQALHSDLGKSAEESYMCETGMVLSEITYQIRHLRRFARPKPVPTPLAQFPSRSYVQPCPYGTVLIMSPWNYPLLLTLGPLADAIAAGNTAIVKPSAYSPATSKLLSELIGSALPKELVAVVTGGREENAFLLEQKFDYI
ncbi:MAG: aldehyde dehydrogenase family protein, partial [Oscillospiraceae bacterium]|nr:aldehyde dehydrogenase family protein [Oscillospiraceae bacterium]